MKDREPRGIDRRTFLRAGTIGTAIGFVLDLLKADTTSSSVNETRPTENQPVSPLAVQNTVVDLSESFFSLFMQNQQSINSKLVIAGIDNSVSPSLGLTLSHVSEMFPDHPPVGMTLIFDKSANENLNQLSPDVDLTFIKELANDVTSLTLTVIGDDPTEYEMITVAKTNSGAWNCSGYVGLPQHEGKVAYYPVRYTTDQSLITSRRMNPLDISVLEDIAGGGNSVLNTLQNALEKNQNNTII
jgi:hypothetical protein